MSVRLLNRGGFLKKKKTEEGKKIKYPPINELTKTIGVKLLFLIRV